MLYRSLSLEFVELPNEGRYYYSYIGYAESLDGIHFRRRLKPFISPEESWENLGCEDPRFVKIDGKYYIFYTAVSLDMGRLNVKIAGCLTRNFRRVEKFGFIPLQGRCKAATLFPEKNNNKYIFLYTQYADTPKSTLFITQLDSVEQLFRKKEFEKAIKIPLLTPQKNAFRGPELGAPPLKTSKGWLLIYCPESFKNEWVIGALLLDLKNPFKIIARTNMPLIKPEMNYEVKGHVKNVTFPTGAVVKDDNLCVYYGGADKVCCISTCNLRGLLEELT